MPDPVLDIHPLGDRALTVTLGARIDEATHRRVRAACARLDALAIPGVIELVGAFASVTVHYDPARVRALDAREAALAPHARLARVLAAALLELDEVEPPPARDVELPVCYGGEMGPDLNDVARAHGVAAEEIVRLHAGGDYLVHMIGFAPGFPYLGGLVSELATPRRATPRTHVRAGSVGIGGSQTGVYPIDSPGGWNIIGRTPLRLFDPAREPPTMLGAGDRLRFRAITLEEFREMETPA